MSGTEREPRYRHEMRGGWLAESVPLALPVLGQHHLLIIHLPFVFRMREQACHVSSRFSTGGASATRRSNRHVDSVQCQDLTLVSDVFPFRLFDFAPCQSSSTISIRRSNRHIESVKCQDVRSFSRFGGWLPESVPLALPVPG